MKNKKLLSPLLAIGIFIVVLLLDLLTKEFIISGLLPNVGDSVNVLPGFINFVYVKNTGAAWGMLAGRPVFLIVISIIVLGLLLAYYLLRLKKYGKHSSILFGISIGLVAGGCVGNLVDRIFLGYVRDFINFQFMEFPVFNFADVALTVGVIVMLVYFVFYFSKEEYLLKKEQNAMHGDGQVSISLSNIDQFENIDKSKRDEEDFVDVNKDKENKSNSNDSDLNDEKTLAENNRNEGEKNEG